MGLVALLVERKAVVGAADDKGVTPLHNASLAGEADVAAYLIYKGTDVNAQDAEGDTPLHFAVREDQVELCALLVAKKADWKIKNKQGLSPQTLAHQLKHPGVLEFFTILESEVLLPLPSHRGSSFILTQFAPILFKSKMHSLPRTRPSGCR